MVQVDFFLCKRFYLGDLECLFTATRELYILPRGSLSFVTGLIKITFLIYCNNEKMQRIRSVFSGELSYLIIILNWLLCLKRLTILIGLFSETRWLILRMTSPLRQISAIFKKISSVLLHSSYTGSWGSPCFTSSILKELVASTEFHPSHPKMLRQLQLLVFLKV